MKLNGKKVNFAQLRDELRAAGALGASGELGYTGLPDDDLHTYDGGGEAASLPAGAKAVLDAHVPKALIDPEAEFEAAVKAATSLAELKAALLGTAGRKGRAAAKGI